jgi:hypothetical protein
MFHTKQIDEVKELLTNPQEYYWIHTILGDRLVSMTKLRNLSREYQMNRDCASFLPVWFIRLKWFLIKIYTRGTIL